MTMEIITSNQNTIQLMRYDEMAESGKGIFVMWPKGHGSSFVNCDESRGDSDGFEYLLKIANEYNINCRDYKLRKAYFELKYGRNYDKQNIKTF